MTASILLLVKNILMGGFMTMICANALLQCSVMPFMAISILMNLVYAMNH